MMLYNGYRSDDETPEEEEDEEASLGDDVLNEMEDTFAVDELDGAFLVDDVKEEEDDEEDVDFDRHDDVDRI